MHTFYVTILSIGVWVLAALTASAEPRAEDDRERSGGIERGDGYGLAVPVDNVELNA